MSNWSGCVLLLLVSNWSGCVLLLSNWSGCVQEDGVPAHMELLGSFNSLITSVEQLQSGFLLNPDGFTEGELATPPRKLLHTLR